MRMCQHTSVSVFHSERGILDQQLQQYASSIDDPRIGGLIFTSEAGRTDQETENIVLED